MELRSCKNKFENNSDDIQSLMLTPFSRSCSPKMLGHSLLHQGIARERFGRLMESCPGHINTHTRELTTKNDEILR